MRKFKAWDKGNGRWLPDGFMKQLFLAQDGTVYWLAYDGLSDVTKAFDIVFCTGLKDKNGIEIYQGDVVSILDPTTRPEPIIGVVKWNELIAAFESFPKGQGWGMVLHGYPMYKNPLVPELAALIGDGTGRTIEIIGDDHTNPELVKS